MDARILMSKKQILISEIEQLPDELVTEVMDFVTFLRIKASNESVETALLSESSLRKDWLRKEEDDAWQDL
jgi:hypothetical protein